MSQQRQSADCIRRKSWNAFTVSTLNFLEAVTSHKFMNFDELKEHMDEVFKETYGVLSGKIRLFGMQGIERRI